MTKDNIKHILKDRVPFLNDSDIESFLKITSYKKIGNKGVILKSGRLSNKIFYILKGSVRGYIVT